MPDDIAQLQNEAVKPIIPAVDKKSVIGFLGDNAGDKSSKRLAGFILLGFFIAVCTFGLIFEAAVGWESIELVKYVAISSLSGSGLCFGLTLSETLIKK